MIRFRPGIVREELLALQNLEMHFLHFECFVRRIDAKRYVDGLAFDDGIGSNAQIGQGEVVDFLFQVFDGFLDISKGLAVVGLALHGGKDLRQGLGDLSRSEGSRERTEIGNHIADVFRERIVHVAHLLLQRTQRGLQEADGCLPVGKTVGKGCLDEGNLRRQVRRLALQCRSDGRQFLVDCTTQ